MRFFKGKVKPRDVSRAERLPEPTLSTLERPWYASYGFLASRVEHLLPRFKWLKSSFVKGNPPVDFTAYVSFLFFATGLSFIVVLAVSSGVSLFILRAPTIRLLGVVFPFLTFPLLVALLTATLTFGSIYSYPTILIRGRKRKIEDSLLYAVSYMSILSTAGLSPERIFRSLATKPEIRGVYEEARLIVRDIDLLGYDFLSALQNALERAPSKLYSEVLEGFISLIYSGGDLAEYLKTRTEELTRIEGDRIRAFIGRLAMLSEVAVTIVAVFPLIFLVIFSMVSLLPGGFLADPLFIYMVVYFILPVISVMFLILLRSR